VGPMVGLDEVKNRKFLTIPGLELRLFGRPARSQSLYRLRYPGTNNNILNTDLKVYTVLEFVRSPVPLT
jgi:hypothetical protein